MALLLKWLLGWASGPVLDKVLGHLQTQRASEVERLRVQSGVDIEHIRANVAISGYYASTIQEGMKHRAFWIPWLIATVPLSLWFGWGALDTLANGGLPDVATLPPQLNEYAKDVWANLFFAGGGVKAAEIVGAALTRRS